MQHSLYASLHVVQTSLLHSRSRTHACPRAHTWSTKFQICRATTATAAKYAYIYMHIYIYIPLTARYLGLPSATAVYADTMYTHTRIHTYMDEYLRAIEGYNTHIHTHTHATDI